MQKTNNKTIFVIFKQFWKGIVAFGVIIGIIAGCITLMEKCTDNSTQEETIETLTLDSIKLPDDKIDDSISKQRTDTLLPIMPKPERNKIKDTIIDKPIESQKNNTLKTIKGEGFGEDMFDESKARKLAEEAAVKNLLSKFPIEKEQIIKRYAETILDTVGVTTRGTYKAHRILSIDESEITD